MLKIYKDVIDFHRKFDFEEQPLGVLQQEKFKKRISFLFEELSELATAHDKMYQLKTDEIDSEALEAYFIGSIDAVLDLAYVALGTLDLMGVKHTQLAEHWDAIQKANMTKMKKEEGGEKSEDEKYKEIIKPEGWVSPDEDHREILRKYWNITND